MTIGGSLQKRALIYIYIYIYICFTVPSWCLPKTLFLLLTLKNCEYMRKHGMRKQCKYMREQGEYMREHSEYMRKQVGYMIKQG